MGNRIAGFLMAGVSCVAMLAAAAFAQQNVHPIDQPRVRPPITVPRPTLAPAPGSTLAPVTAVTPGPIDGMPVPLSALPPLPPQTSANTITPDILASHKRTFAANGATISVSGLTGATGCATALGDRFPVGCTLTWKSSTLPTTGTSTPKYEDYYILPSDGVLHSVATNNYSGPGPGSTHTLVLTQGITVFGVYDSVNHIWQAVVYVTAGNPVDLKVYQDPFYSEESYQFDATGSGDAYIHITNLSSSDLYVVSIEQTSVNPNCVFSAPAESPAPAANVLCVPTNSAGATAAGGALNVTWPILGTYSAGAYVILLFDKTTNTRLGKVQVSLTGSAGNTLSLSTDVSTANSTTPPSPAPAGAGGIRSVFAWDSANEQSVSGITIGAAAVPAGNYVWSFNDPIGFTTSAIANGISGIASHTFTFSSSSVLTPGNYPGHEFSAALYNSTSKTVYASQAFRVLGYQAKTTFSTTSEVAALSIAAGGNTTATLKLLNNSELYYGTGNGDPFAGIAFSTDGTDFTATAGQGSGVEMALSGFTLAQCAKSAGGCSTTIADSAGTSWTVNDYCSDAVVNTTSDCYLVATPASSGSSLAVSASISIPNIKFYAATGFACTGSNCVGATSVLPLDGVKWSVTTSNEAWTPVFFSNGSSSLSGTGHVVLYGAYNSAGTAIVGPEVHMYPVRFNQSVYEAGSPYVVAAAQTTANMNIYAITIHNTSTSASITQIAFAIPGPYDSTGYITIDNTPEPANTSWWTLPGVVRCLDPNVRIDCIQADNRGGGNGHNTGIGPGATQTIYLGLTAPPGAFPYQDWALFSYLSSSFALPADGTASVPVNSPSLAVDTLALAAYSLNSSYMTPTFSPSSAGAGATASEGFLLTNTTLAADPNPDYVDAVVVAVPTTITVSGAPTTSTTGWSYLGNDTTKAVGGFRNYWFGTCVGQYVVADSPPTANPANNTTLQPALPTCTAGQEANSLAPGSTLATAFTFTGLATGSYTFSAYAHGANGNGWSSPKAVALPVTAVSASAGFTKAGQYLAPPAVATNAVPTIGGNSDATHGNSYVYTIKNTSNATAITQATITVPGLDINGVNATDSSGDFWTITVAPTLSYSGGATTCTVTTSNATSGGADGSITISGGTCSIAAGKTMTVTFAAKGPQSQNDSYAWPTTINNGAATAGESWLGDTRVQVQLSIGLDVVVNPSNPGPGGSTPVISCPGCSFSGSTADFGTVGSSSSASFLDTVRASVYITSATVVNWTLSISTSLNPANSTGVPTNELQTSIDNTRSTTGAGIVFDQTAFAVVPTAGSLQVAHGASVTSRTLPYDLLQNFKVSMGSESVTANAATLTYTLVAN